ncbi:MAG: ATP-binding cassette domain-containing protein [Mariprofundaceae bacterium]|nr:ATP-binding cassette domain-containing protein [Mariprofundaceae bacterium]
MNTTWRAGREITVLFGPSGSGKTTLLRMIAGLEQPDEGCISAANRVLFDKKNNLKPEERHVGFVFQDYALFPWLTVRKNIQFGIPRGQRRSSMVWVDTLITTFGLGPLLDKRPARLSGGEAQRVALARALAPHPELLLMDEPFSAVDGTLRIQLRNFIRDIQKKWNIPVILVTHDLTEAHLIGDHLVRLDAGRVSYEGPIDGLVQNISTELMAAY